MPQQFRHLLYGASVRTRTPYSRRNASSNTFYFPATTPSDYRLDQLLLFGISAVARQLYRHSPIVRGRQAKEPDGTSSLARLTTHLLTDTVLDMPYGFEWVSAGSPNSNDSSADLSWILTSFETPTSSFLGDIGLSAYTQGPDQLYVLIPKYQHKHFHRCRVNEATLSHPSVNASFSLGVYPTNFDFGTLGQRPINLVLPSKSTVVAPYVSRAESDLWATAREAIVLSIRDQPEAGDGAARGKIAAWVNTLEPTCLSAVSIDPRSGDQWITAAVAELATGEATHFGEYFALSHSWTSYPNYTVGYDYQNPKQFSYLSLCLFSKSVASGTAGFNSAIETGYDLRQLTATRGASTGGNTAMPMDYDTWDFAATCIREFSSVSVPYKDNLNPPASHSTFDEPTFFRIHQPEMRSIGSPMSLLPERESQPSRYSKPYYHGSAGQEIPDLRSADLSLVMLKGLSLLSESGPILSDASTLVPVLHSQSAFRFDGRNITGTTVRFDPIAFSSGESFGSTLPALPEPVALPDVQWEKGFFFSFSPSTSQQDFSGEYWVDGFDSAAGFFIPGDYRDLLQIVPGSALTLVVQSNRRLIPNTFQGATYDSVVYRSPNSVSQNPFALPQFSVAQSFTKLQGWDEVGYSAGIIAQRFIEAQSPSGWLRFPKFTVPGTIVRAGGREMGFEQSRFPMPLLCGKDYECGPALIAGEQAAAGIFSYDGPGPQEEVEIAYNARGIKATSVFQSEPYNTTPENPFPPGNTYRYKADVSFEPYDLDATISIAMDTPQVSLFVRWHASLQGIGAYRAGNSPYTSGVDIDDQLGKLSPFHYVRHSRINEIKPVLIAELWMTARSTASASIEWDWPEALSQLPASFDAKGQSGSTTASLESFNVFVDGRFQMPGYVQPGPFVRIDTDDVKLYDKTPFLAGVFAFNREQTGRLLQGQEVIPTRWLEYDEGDARGNEPQLIRWHTAQPATIRPSFKLKIS